MLTEETVVALFDLELDVLEVQTVKYNLSPCKQCKAAGRNHLPVLPFKVLQMLHSASVQWVTEQ